MSEKDRRIAYGTTCTWWDSIHNVGSTATHPAHAATRNVTLKRPDGSVITRPISDHGLPCCPHCGCMLFEVPDEQTWLASVDKYEAASHPGYRAFIEWQRGKCFASMEGARATYIQETGKQVVI